MKFVKEADWSLKAPVLRAYIEGLERFHKRVLRHDLPSRDSTVTLLETEVQRKAARRYVEKLEKTIRNEARNGHPALQTLNAQVGLRKDSDWGYRTLELCTFRLKDF